LLWVKAFHVVFFVSWYAGLLYLPRLFVYHAGTSDEPGRSRFVTMERKLYAMMSIGALGTVFFGIWLLWGGWWEAASGMGWLHAKLALVAVLVGYHFTCDHFRRRFAAGANTHTERFYRFFNEVPALILVAIALLAVVKPF